MAGLVNITRHALITSDFRSFLRHNDGTLQTKDRLVRYDSTAPSASDSAVKDSILRSTHRRFVSLLTELFVASETSRRSSRQLLRAF